MTRLGRRYCGGSDGRNREINRGSQFKNCGNVILEGGANDGEAQNIAL